jgi:REP element-mobilizing transposase RayT
MDFNRSRQIRLPYYNYASTGLYFITICVYLREYLFGDIHDGKMLLTPIGDIARQCWDRIPASSTYAGIDSFVVMPNHIHGIISIDNPEEKLDIPEKKFEPRKRSLSIVVRNYKTAVSIKSRVLYPAIRIWQPRFFDRIIRSEKELHAVRRYIENNPQQWHEDKNNPENLTM